MTAVGTERRVIRVVVNGVPYEREVEARLLLSDFLRHELGLTGTHVGCEHGVCGACTVLFDGEPVRSCLLLAVQADGHAIETVEARAKRVGAPSAAARILGKTWSAVWVLYAGDAYGPQGFPGGTSQSDRRGDS